MKRGNDDSVPHPERQPYRVSTGVVPETLQNIVLLLGPGKKDPA